MGVSGSGLIGNNYLKVVRRPIFCKNQTYSAYIRIGYKCKRAIHLLFERLGATKYITKSTLYRINFKNTFTPKRSYYYI